MRQEHRLRWWLALPFSAFGGFALDLAAPAIAWWPAAMLGAVLICAAVWQQRLWLGFVYGLIAGATFWFPHISWLTLYLGPIPWIALSSVMISWFALFGLAAATTTRGLALLLNGQSRNRPLITVLAQSLAVASLWVVRELLQSTWPYGGFAWGRIAHTQAEGPLVALISWLGFAGLSGLIVLVAALITGSLLTVGLSQRFRILLPMLSIAALAALSFIQVAPTESAGTLRVAAVQGNSKSAIFDDRENGDVIRDHIDATSELLDQLESRGEHVDVIVWPENSAEFQIPEHTLRALEVQRLSARAAAPILVGTILQDADDVFTNSVVIFDSEGHTGQRYDKRRPVPFAEYMPNRAFFRSLVPDLVDLVQLDYAFGERSSALPVRGQFGEVLAGIAICFDIIFDDHAVAMSEDGAQVIFAPTNNADFGRTDESAQQLQIARLRAVEMGRALVNISTVGTSAIVLPDGSSAAELTPFTADSMVAEVPLVNGATPALAFGSLIAAGFIAIALVGLTLAAIGLIVRRPN